MTYSCATGSFSSGFLTGFWASFVEVYICIFFIAILLYSLVSYCLKSFGMYKMAKNRNFDNAYLAWLPFARFYLFGKISDDINKQKNVKSSHKGILLTLSVLNCVSSLILFVFLFVSIAEFLGAAASSTYTISYDYWTNFITNKVNSFLIIITIIYIVSLLFNIFYCIYAHNIFKDYVPKLSGLLCVVIVLTLFVFNDSLIDSAIFLSISTNEPESLKNNNQIVY